MLDAPLASPTAFIKRQALQLLGIAMAVSVVLAFPMEQVTHSKFAPGSYWLQNSCDSTIFLLNSGLMLQAILAPLLVFLLPGPGCIFQRKVRVRPPSSVRASALPVARALARPEDHAGARKSVATSEARSLIAVVAVIVGIVGLLMLLRSGWQLKHIDFFPNQPSASHSVSFLRSVVFSQTMLDLAIGLTGIGGAVFLLYQYLPWRGALFMLVGWLSAAAIPFVWWYGLRGYAESRGLCPALFDTSRPIDPFHIDLVQDCQRYFMYLSGFSALWVGVTAGGLRLQSARSEDGDLSGTELRSFQNFFWLYLLGWAVQYRLSQWLTGPTRGTNVEQEWITWSVLCFVYLTASSLWSLVFIRFFWNLKAKTWIVNVIAPFGGTFAICILTMLTFFWLFLRAPLALVPLYTLNVSGMAWALAVGTWRWRGLQKQPFAVAVATAETQPAENQPTGSQPREQRPALLGLRALEIAAAAVAGLAILGIAYGLYIWFFVVNKSPGHR
jgi:hypothetical protein